ncbi:MAG: chemotaxis-specific protein-glutamate methyltransferase CheB [Nannocystaceae bacterium]|nr:chemotaxis-specific protein-glutamate methyltransferase CheB [Nannocystaceae bacterium]
MKKYKIVLVDDSAMARALLSETLTSAPTLEVAYAAPTAELGLSFLAKHQEHVDLVMLDVAMPKVDGIEALRRIRKNKNWSHIPVLMCSSLTDHTAEVTVRALSEGASDFISKPSSAYPKERFTADLLSAVHVLLGQEHKGETASAAAPPVQRLRPASTTVSPEGVRAVAIGCSTGGPNALARVFGTFYRPLGAPMFIVQHMPASFTPLLASRLSSQSGQLVKEGEDGEPVAPGVCYLAPGGRHMTVARKGVDVRIVLHEEPPENFCRPAVDVLFRGLAQVYGGNVFAAVLTGMGRDGAKGAADLANAGSTVVVQEPKSCVVASMPNASLDIGAAVRTMSLEDIGRELDRCTADKRAFAKAGMR